MDIHDAQKAAAAYANELALLFQKLPGSAILLRYIRSSYQNDPIRSVFEALLILFAIRYALSSRYSTQKAKNVKLTEEVRVPDDRDMSACFLTQRTGDR